MRMGEVADGWMDGWMNGWMTSENFYRDSLGRKCGIRPGLSSGILATR